MKVTFQLRFGQNIFYLNKILTVLLKLWQESFFKSNIIAELILELPFKDISTVIVSQRGAKSQAQPEKKNLNDRERFSEFLTQF